MFPAMLVDLYSGFREYGSPAVRIFTNEQMNQSKILIRTEDIYVSLYQDIYQSVII